MWVFHFFNFRQNFWALWLKGLSREDNHCPYALLGHMDITEAVPSPRCQNGKLLWKIGSCSSLHEMSFYYIDGYSSELSQHCFPQFKPLYQQPLGRCSLDLLCKVDGHKVDSSGRLTILEGWLAQSWHPEGRLQEVEFPKFSVRIRVMVSV